MQDDQPATIGPLLDRGRRRAFVGRARELDDFRAALDRDDAQVIFVSGPGGVGKSTLLDAFAALARERGRIVFSVDTRDVQPSADSLEAAVVRAAHGDLASLDGGLLLLDTFELVPAAERWLRTELIPRLPRRLITVVAGREPPSPEWRADPAWSELLATVALDGLSPQDSAALLGARGVAATLHPRLHALTHGHPLALALVAESARDDDLELGPDLVHELVRRFMRDVPPSTHRRALLACAIAAALDQDLLQAALDEVDVAPLFDWLRSLSFIRHGEHGLFPHDLARDVLESDGWYTAGEAYRAVRRRIGERLLERLEATDDRVRKEQLAHAFLFSRRRSATAGRYFTWSGSALGKGVTLAASNSAEVAELVGEYEGPESVRATLHWLAKQPQAFTGFRDDHGRLQGVFSFVWIDRRDPEDERADPAVAAAWRHTASAPPGPGEGLLYLRLHVVRGAYHDVSPIQDMVQARSILRWLTTPGMAWSFVATTRPDRWGPQFERMLMPYSEVASFVTDGCAHSVYARDWRRYTARDWFLNRPGAPTAAHRPTEALGETAFAAAVRDALSNFASERQLARNPLLQSRVLAASDDTGASAVSRLRALLRDAAAEIGAHPRDAKFATALEARYFRPAPTQEAAAERAGVPYGSFRRHVATAVERLIAILWDREAG